MGGEEAGAVVFAEVGNLIRRKNKNSHCAGESERGLEEIPGVGLQARWKGLQRGRGGKGPQSLEGQGRYSWGQQERRVWGTTQSGLIPWQISHRG